MDDINECLQQETEQQQAANSHSTSLDPEQCTDSQNSWEFPNTITSHGAQRPFIPHHRRERSRSMAELTSATSTLGHRNWGPLEVEEWSTPAKCRLTDFAQGVCADLGVPVEQRNMIIEKGQVRLMTTRPTKHVIAS